MQTAQAVYRDAGQILVVCPYCHYVHAHGDGATADISGNTYSAHCHQGEYRVLGMYDFRVAHMMLNRRQADLERKRTARQQRAAQREASRK